MKRLTASNFGAAIKRKKKNNPLRCIGKKILNTSNTLETPAMAYGKQNETIAIRVFEEKMKSVGKTVFVSPSGLFIDVYHGFLVASPDCINDIKNKYS